jgi:hypothetical protein
MPKSARSDSSSQQNSNYLVGPREYIAEAIRIGIPAPYVILHAHSVPLLDRYVHQLTGLLRRTGNLPIIKGDSGYFIPFDTSSGGKVAAQRVVDRFDGAVLDEKYKMAMDIVTELNQGSKRYKKARD